MKKSGFTLAEILITLSIIGVVAALSAPALLQDASNARTGPALEKTKAAIELANQNILFRNRATDLLAVRNQMDAAEYLQLLAQNFQNSTFLQAPREGEENFIGTFSFTGRNGTQNGTREWSGTESSANDRTPKLILADNVTISVNEDNPPYYNFNNGLDASGNPADNGHLGQRGSYRGPLANLLIDLNGTQVGPNMYGRDIFFFTVDRSGVVIPDGSKLFYESEGGRIDGYMTWNGNGAPLAFDSSNCDCPGNGRGCAGRILDNGRKVDYK